MIGHKNWLASYVLERRANVVKRVRPGHVFSTSLPDTGAPSLADIGTHR